MSEGVLLIKRGIWEGTDRAGQLLLSKEAREYMTLKGKRGVRLIEETEENKR